MTRPSPSSITLLGLAAAFAAGTVSADGTEQLGDPSIPIAVADGVIAGGVGLVDLQPNSFLLDVPLDATIVQVLAYWEAFAGVATGHHATEMVLVDGQVVVGDQIGGVTQFFGGAYTATYRADVTGLGLITNGVNLVEVSDLDFKVPNGFGLLVLIDQPGVEATFQLQDGNDAAFVNFAGSLQTTEVVSYDFVAAAEDREATLSHLVSSVSSESLFGSDRPTTIQVGFDGGPATIFEYDMLGNTAGDDFDVFEHSFTVPAGSTSLQVQILSEDSGLGVAAGNLPASLVWIATGLTLDDPLPPPPTGGEGCTPGYWKNHVPAWGPTGYAPGDSTIDVFGVSVYSGQTLMNTVRKGGGQLKALGRHAVAALLNANHPEIDYPWTEAEIIAAVQAAVASEDAAQIEGLKDELDTMNNLGCDL